MPEAPCGRWTENRSTGSALRNHPARSSVLSRSGDTLAVSRDPRDGCRLLANRPLCKSTRPHMCSPPLQFSHGWERKYECRHDYLPLSQTGDGVRFSDEIRRRRRADLGIKSPRLYQLS